MVDFRSTSTNRKRIDRALFHHFRLNCGSRLKRFKGGKLIARRKTVGIKLNALNTLKNNCVASGLQGEGCGCIVWVARLEFLRRKLSSRKVNCFSVANDGAIVLIVNLLFWKSWRFYIVLALHGKCWVVCGFSCFSANKLRCFFIVFFSLLEFGNLKNLFIFTTHPYQMK